MPIETYKDVIIEKELIIPVEKIIEKRIKKSTYVPREIEVERIVEVP